MLEKWNKKLYKCHLGILNVIFFSCSANNYSQLIDLVHLDWTLHWKSHLFRKPISILIRFSSLIFASFFFIMPCFKTENSWSNKAKSICQQQKPQRRPCSELLKYLTTNDDPPQTKPAENRNSSKEKCTSKRKPHLQSQTNHLQGRCWSSELSFGIGGKLTCSACEYPPYAFCSLD